MQKTKINFKLSGSSDSLIVRRLHCHSRLKFLAETVASLKAFHQQEILETLMISPRYIVHLTFIYSLMHIREVSSFLYLTNIRHN